MFVLLSVGLTTVAWSVGFRMPTHEQDEILRDFTEACQRSGLRETDVADIMGISRQQLGQQLRGEGHLSFNRFYALKRHPDGQRFLWAYLPLVAKTWGFPEADIAFRLCELAKSVDLKEVLRDSIGRVVDVFQTRLARAQLHQRERDDHNKEGVA